MAKEKREKEVSLVGTLISVLMIGGIITLMWFSVYAFYLQR
ncbi:cytochrome C oxidase subunit II [Falsibacillus pallidus]|uniref:Cytochrome c oxidase subunit IIa family protein n=1 Tax=Falsibacillus pallidus TaxID=493781 RepID=A0A370GRM2_9BACI|nr:cytochrome C oxidase subunit II [Falsibacillus pallidus]RDI45896.1 hypothetical protein DFR59_102531 [Falsibacillus pallidus]